MTAQDPKIEAPFPDRAHNHQVCVSAALSAAAKICDRRRIRLTPLRRRVLELVWGGHAPVGAYDILKHLSQEHEGAAPPTVYRALDFLLEQGFVHRIESLNAYVGCANPDRDHVGQFLICKACGSTAELHEQAIDEAIALGADKRRFLVQRSTVEAHGLCPSCRTSDDGDGTN